MAREAYMDGLEEEGDVEGGPADEEQQHGDDVHLGCPPLLPVYQLTSIGYLVSQAAQVSLETGGS